MTLSAAQRDRDGSERWPIPESQVYQHLTAVSDPIRTRLLLTLEGHELTVRELQQILQLPQSTVSRHLGVLAAAGWVTSRSAGPSNWYRMAGGALPELSRQLWQAVRPQALAARTARSDAERRATVLGARQTRSRQFFATTAGRWDRLRAEWFGHSADLAPLLGLASRDWVVADLGCGTGQLAEQLAPHVARLIAVDDSTPMLDAARERLATHGNVDLRVGSLEDLPLEDRSIDVAFLVLVLHHLPDPARALAEARRVLRAQGKVVIVDMAPHERTEYRDTMGHQWLGFGEGAIRRCCETAGLAEPTYQLIRPEPAAKGPALFVATAVSKREQG
jgi:ArsR family transcriptional regulator